MRPLILTTASVIALGVGVTFAGITPAAAWTHHSAMHSRHQMTQVSRAEVRDIQQKLQADNLYSGKVDGLMGSQTRRAIAEFQKQNGLRVTASLDRQTRDSLLGTMGTATPPAQPPAHAMPMPPPSGQGAANMPGPNIGGGTHPAPTGGPTATGR
jgi:peptidoglycan hydrolase-like protein with peptidoglycan-binding domain